MVPPRTIDDVSAALRFIRKAYMMDRLNEEMGITDIAALNLLDGIGEFIRGQQAR